MNTTDIINFLKANPGSIASEIGTTNVVMRDLEEQGLVSRLGNRSTGKRGRPPVEWVAGELTDEQKAEQEKKAEAKEAAPKEPKEKKPKAPPTLSELPAGIGDEDRRKVVYIDTEVLSGRRDDSDVTFLLGVRKDILRRYNNAPSPLNVVTEEIEEAA